MSNPPAQRDPAAAHNFQTVLGLVEDGQLLADLTRALESLLGDMANHAMTVGGVPKGSLSVKLDFKLEDGIVEVGGKMDTTSPKRVGGRTIFWLTPDNKLTGRNPKQTEMGFRDVTAGREVRSV